MQEEYSHLSRVVPLTSPHVVSGSRASSEPCQVASMCGGLWQVLSLLRFQMSMSNEQLSLPNQRRPRSLVHSLAQSESTGSDHILFLFLFFPILGFHLSLANLPAKILDRLVPGHILSEIHGSHLGRNNFHGRWPVGWSPWEIPRRGGAR